MQTSENLRRKEKKLRLIWMPQLVLLSNSASNKFLGCSEEMLCNCQGLKGLEERRGKGIMALFVVVTEK